MSVFQIDAQDEVDAIGILYQIGCRRRIRQRFQTSDQMPQSQVPEPADVIDTANAGIHQETDAVFHQTCQHLAIRSGPHDSVQVGHVGRSRLTHRFQTAKDNRRIGAVRQTAAQRAIRIALSGNGLHRDSAENVEDGNERDAGNRISHGGDPVRLVTEADDRRGPCAFIRPLHAVSRLRNRPDRACRSAAAARPRFPVRCADRPDAA